MFSEENKEKNSLVSSGAAAASAPVVELTTEETKLRAFYTKHEPTKLDNVPLLLAKYAGKESELWGRLEGKYGRAAVRQVLGLKNLRDSSALSSAGATEAPLTRGPKAAAPTFRFGATAAGAREGCAPSFVFSAPAVPAAGDKAPQVPTIGIAAPGPTPAAGAKATPVPAFGFGAPAAPAFGFAVPVPVPAAGAKAAVPAFGFGAPAAPAFGFAVPVTAPAAGDKAAVPAFEFAAPLPAPAAGGKAAVPAFGFGAPAAPAAGAKAVPALDSGRKQRWRRVLRQQCPPKTGNIAPPGPKAAATGPLDHKVRLTALYAQHDPAKLEKVDSFLEKYAGREDTMFAALAKKYNVPEVHNGASPAFAEVTPVVSQQPMADAKHGPFGQPALSKIGSVVSLEPPATGDEARGAAAPTAGGGTKATEEVLLVQVIKDLERAIVAAVEEGPGWTSANLRSVQSDISKHRKERDLKARSRALKALLARTKRTQEKLRKHEATAAKARELGLAQALAAALAGGEEAAGASGSSVGGGGERWQPLCTTLAGTFNGRAASLRVHAGSRVGLGLPGAFVAWGELGPGAGCVLVAAPVAGLGASLGTSLGASTDLIALVDCPTLHGAGGIHGTLTWSLAPGTEFGDALGGTLEVRGARGGSSSVFRELSLVETAAARAATEHAAFAAATATAAAIASGGGEHPGGGGCGTAMAAAASLRLALGHAERAAEEEVRAAAARAARLRVAVASTVLRGEGGGGGAVTGAGAEGGAEDGDEASAAAAATASHAAAAALRRWMRGPRGSGVASEERAAAAEAREACGAYDAALAGARRAALAEARGEHGDQVGGGGGGVAAAASGMAAEEAGKEPSSLEGWLEMRDEAAERLLASADRLAKGSDVARLRRAWEGAASFLEALEAAAAADSPTAAAAGAAADPEGRGASTAPEEREAAVVAALELFDRRLEPPTLPETAAALAALAAFNASRLPYGALHGEVAAPRVASVPDAAEEATFRAMDALRAEIAALSAWDPAARTRALTATVAGAAALACAQVRGDAEALQAAWTSAAGSATKASTLAKALAGAGCSEGRLRRGARPSPEDLASALDEAVEALEEADSVAARAALEHSEASKRARRLSRSAAGGQSALLSRKPQPQQPQQPQQLLLQQQQQQQQNTPRDEDAFARAAAELEASRAALATAQGELVRLQRVVEAERASLRALASGPFPELFASLAFLEGGNAALDPELGDILVSGRSLAMYKALPWPAAAAPEGNSLHDVGLYLFGEAGGGPVGDGSDGGVGGGEATVVVLKAVSLTAASGERALKRSVAALTRLKGHPNVVAVDAVFLEGDKAYLQSTFHPNGALSTYLKRPDVAAPRLPDPNGGVVDRSSDRASLVTVPCLRQALSALAAAHAKGVVHGDVKLANMLVDADGCVRLADFDLARVDSDGGGGGSCSGGVKAAAAATATTCLGAGTPLFRAPEVLCGGGATSASDVFAFGVCALLALAPGLAEALTPPVAPPTAILAGADVDLSSFLCQAMAPAPGDRPSAAELLEHSLFALRPDAKAAAVREAAAAARERSCCICGDIFADGRSAGAECVGDGGNDGGDGGDQGTDGSGGASEPTDMLEKLTAILGLGKGVEEKSAAAGGGCGIERHFTCGECLAGHVASLTDEDGFGGFCSRGGAVPCPGVGASSFLPCGAPPLAHADLARALPPAALAKLGAARDKVLLARYDKEQAAFFATVLKEKEAEWVKLSEEERSRRAKRM